MVIDLGKREKHFLLHSLKEIKLLDELVKNNAIIAGGSIRAIFTDKPIKDYDLYFPTEADLKNILSIFNAPRSKITKIVETITAVTYKKDGITLQIITKPEFIISDPEILINTFDFTVCMGAYSTGEDKLYLDKDFMKHNSQKRLVFNPCTRYPIATLMRIKKYTGEYGYSISNIELMKIALCINKIGIDTYEKLKEQLLGIDTLFLQPLTDEISKKGMDHKEYKFEDFMFLLEEHLNKCFDTTFRNNEEEEI